jgi:hypothetical protein
MGSDDGKFDSAYDFEDFDSHLSLYKGKVEIDHEGTQYQCEGEVLLELTPRPRIVFKGIMQGLPVDIFKKRTAFLLINGRKFEGSFFNVGMGSNTQGIKINWAPKFGQIAVAGDECTQIKKWCFIYLTLLI